MATDILRERSSDIGRERKTASDEFEFVRRYILQPLASLRLTVVLFALSMVLVFTGTLAQVERDIWEVMGIYFRSWWVNIPLQVFFPPAFSPTGTPPQVPGFIPFPGGFLIGAAMLINLLAAHALRFTVQARGTRLAAGLGVIVAGIGLTAAIVVGTSSGATIQDMPTLGWSRIWGLFKIILAGLWVATAYGLFKLPPSRKLEWYGLTSLSVGLGALVVWLVFRGEAVMPSPPTLRVLWQLMVASVPAAVLLAGCHLAFRKRAGIVLLHAGVGLIMCNELVVYMLHEEAHMRINEGQTVNFVEDSRTFELAVVDSSPEDHENVVVVPRSHLAGTSVIRHEDLPFDIQPVQYFQNSELYDVKAGDTTVATTGLGLRVGAKELPPVPGTDSQRADAPSAYVTLLSKENGEPIGTHLVSLGLIRPDTVTVGDKTYELSLRYRRIYKDYSVNLIDVKRNDYLGTDTPRNYSSDIRLVDTANGVDREVKIWMNNPLRYAGETFYQSSWGVNQDGTEQTTLQVVKNHGWMIPYIACMIVGFGMLYQFSFTLLRFLRRRNEGQITIGDDGVAIAEPVGKRKRAPAAEPKSRWRWAVPLVAVLLCAGWLAGKARVPEPAAGEMNLYEFGELPLVYQGRVKPFDTLARNSLRIISDKEEITLEDGKKLSATEWLLDVISRPQQAAKHRVVRIENLEVLDLLGLQRRKGFRYAIDEFRDRIGAYEGQVKQARSLGVEHLTTYQRKLLELDQRLRLYMVLTSAFDQLNLEDAETPQDLVRRLESQREALTQMQAPLTVPVGDKDETWLPYAQAWSLAWLQTNVPALRGELNQATLSLNNIFIAYAKQDGPAFNTAVDKYKTWLEANAPADYSVRRTNFESYFNHLAPFYHASVLYVLAFIVAAVGWLGWTKPLNRASFWIIVFTLILHTFALIARIYISGRPPVTNLYTTAIFIGWGCALLGVIFEITHRLGVGNVVASVSGFSTLLIAHFLAGDGDTFTVLQAVLDTQFWLATHVTTINFGYSTTLVAGLLGCLYVLQGVLSPSLTPKMSKEIARMIYGTLCFSILFSFIGTVLGGLWADDSWGRFWGWDPKENGALLIVIWNALVLHARWAGMVKDRGVAVLSIFGNIVVGWSWFGVNELGVGLHSYGFTEGVLRNLGLFTISQLAVIVIGSLPKDLWWSNRQHPASAAA